MRNKFIVILLSLFMISCMENSKNTNPNKPSEIITISSNFIFENDSYGKQYIINTDNINVNLNGKSIDNNGEYASFIINASNVTIRNGMMKGTGFETGIYLSSCVSINDVEPLNTQGFNYEKTIYNRCDTNTTIDNIKFDNLRTGIYVADYNYSNKIINNKFSNIDRMAIYLSPGSYNNSIKNNSFVNIGYRHIESYGRPRGSISFDSSYGNIVANNYFKSNPKWVNTFSKEYRVPELEFYRNCGETTFGDIPLPRLHGADSNKIINNTFEQVGLVAWFKYRDHHNICSNVIYADKSDNNSITGSKLINIGDFVYDEGTNNIW